MILSDADIRARLRETHPLKRLIVTPMVDPDRQIQPASVDLRLGNEFLFLSESTEMLDPVGNGRIDRPQIRRLGPGEAVEIAPGQLVLASTLEFVALPADVAGRLEGRSSWGRLGLKVHSTAGFIDPGFRGNLTFELGVEGGAPIRLYPGLRIAQISLVKTLTPAETCYGEKSGAKYGGCFGVRYSRADSDPEIGSLRNSIWNAGRKNRNK